MGASLSGNKLGRPSRRRRSNPIGEINVTPMVDVMLVLLIVFMVAAPLMTSSIPVDLPKISAKAMETKTEPVVVTINKEGLLFLKDSETNIDVLVKDLRERLEKEPDLRVYIRGDKDLAYGAIMGVMGRLNAAGILKVALVAEHPSGGIDSSKTKLIHRKDR